jgi:predicted GNAT family acetyltransferase
MTDHPQDLTVKHLPDTRRFEISLNGGKAFTEYILAGERIIFTHTEVPPELVGKGLASRLAREALDFARGKSLRIIPLCPFVAGYIRRHPEYKAFLQAGYRVD